MEQKWINDGGVFYPVSGDTKLHVTPGKGIFELVKTKAMSGERVGLKYVDDSFKFNFEKIYDIGADDFIKDVKKTWESDYFVQNNKNLGIILNGLKGTGKTISAKLLCNSLDLPVILINNSGIEEIPSFIQQLNFECIVLIDEAEKTFKKNEDDEVLLKLIDGVYNITRKFYILTTNKLDLNENLLGRPGRIRYIKQFGNLSKDTVNKYVEDNLNDKSKKNDVLRLIDILEISTIDILRCIVEEVNIQGHIDDNTYINIPRARYTYSVLRLGKELNESRLNEFKKLINGIKDLNSWLAEYKEEKVTNEDWIYNEFEIYVEKMTSSYSTLWKGSDTSLGTILEEPTEDGWLLLKTWYGDEIKCKIIRKKGNPSLYRGDL